MIIFQCKWRVAYIVYQRVNTFWRFAEIQRIAGREIGGGDHDARTRIIPRTGRSVPNNPRHAHLHPGMRQ